MAHTPLHTLSTDELIVVSAHTDVPARDRRMARTILVNRQVRAQSTREANAMPARITHRKGVAGQYEYTAHTDDGPLTFVGSEYGGPIVMITPSGAQTFVTDPGRFASGHRFGCLLDETWVRNFLGEGS